MENNLTEEQAANLKVNAVNAKATLTYNDVDGNVKAMDFPIPYVRGLTYTFNFAKVDAKENTKTLAGAEFQIVGDNGYVVKANSDKNGVVTFTGIPWGNYKLTETKAPGGYILDTNEPILLPTIGYVEDMKDGNLDDHSYVSGANYKWIGKPNSELVKISESGWQIENTPGAELPATGGIGTLPYTFGGLGFILVSGLMYVYRMRHRRERRSR